MKNDFFIEHASWESEQVELRQVREAVFIVEQQVSREEEWDELDARSHHVLARDIDGHPIGTGRLTPGHKIGRMAVLENWRNCGVGAALLRTLIEHARALAYAEITLHAQISAVGFYEKFGFTCEGDEFIEANIRHRFMRLQLPPYETPDRPGDHAPASPASKAAIIVTCEQAQATVLDLLELTRREMVIYTRDLDAALLNSQACLEALRRIGIAGRDARVRILLQNPLIPIEQGHRLILLAQRLPTVFLFRVPSLEQDQQYPSAFVLNDRGGFYFRPLGSRFEGESNTYAPGRHRQLLAYFDEIWERSEPAKSMAVLSL